MEIRMTLLIKVIIVIIMNLRNLFLSIIEYKDFYDKSFTIFINYISYV